MQFLADESCDFAVVRALCAADYDVKAVRDVMPGAPDEEVAELAVQESRILLTEDKDFGQIVFASSNVSPGVIFIRFPGNARKTMAQTIIQLVQKSAENLKGRFVVVQPGRIRISERVGEP